jgi:hypothetical protein
MHEDYRAQRFDDAIDKCKLLYTHFDHKMEKYYDMWIERCEYMKTQDLPSGLVTVCLWPQVNNICSTI